MNKKYFDISVNSYDYKLLSDYEKLNVVKEKINALIGATKGSARVYYNGKRVSIPKDKIKEFKDLCIRERSLSKRVTIEDDSEDNKISIDTNIPYKKREVTSDNEKIEYAFVDKDIFALESLITVKKHELEKLFSLYKNDEYKDKKVYTVNYKNEKRYIPYSLLGEAKKLCHELSDLEHKMRLLLKEKNKISIEDKIDDNTIDNDISDKVIIDKTEEVPLEDTPSEVIDNVRDYYEDINKEKKGKSLFKFGIFNGILNKVKDKTISIKNKIKEEADNVRGALMNNKVKTAICALGMASVMLITSFIPRSSNKNKDNTISNGDTGHFVLYESDEYDNKSSDAVIEENYDNIEEEYKVDTIDYTMDNSMDNTYEEIEDYMLGDTVTFNDNSYIYTNSYSATEENNYYTPMFDGNIDRTVVGVVYELDGNIYTIYNYEEDSIDKINALKEKGARETSVLVVRSDLIDTGSYEGYYNVDSVKTRVRK